MNLKVAAILFPALALSGCVRVHKVLDPPRPQGPVATLAYNSKLILYILKIDGRRVMDDDLDHFELSAGIHTLSLRFHEAPLQMKVHNGSEFDLSFDTRAGHQYRIEFSISPDHSRWSAHILDLDTRSRASSIITDAD